MSPDITGQLDDSITNFKTFNEAISKSKQKTQNEAIKYLASILKKLMELIGKVRDRTYAKIAEEKFIESKAGTAVKDKKTMHDLAIAFDDHVDHARSIMKIPANFSRKKKIKEALKQAEDVLFSMAKHQDKMKKEEDRFQETLPEDSETSSTKNQDANDNFRTIGRQEKAMDGKQYINELDKAMKQFVNYSSKLDKKLKAGYDAAQIGLRRDEQMAWEKLQKNSSSYFDNNGNHVVVNQKNKERTVTTPDEKKITVTDADGNFIEETISDDTGVTVRYKDGSSLYTAPNGSSLFTSHDGTKVATKNNGSSISTSPDGLTVTRKDRAGKTSYTTVTNAHDKSYYIIDDNDATQTKSYFNSKGEETDEHGNLIDKSVFDSEKDINRNKIDEYGNIVRYYY